MNEPQSHRTAARAGAEARRRAVAPLVAASLCLPLAAAAQMGGDGWSFEITPYIWGAALDGTVSINDRPAQGLRVDEDFSDILKIIDFGLMGAFEARKGRWGVHADGIYFKISEGGSFSGPAGLVAASAGATITQQVYSLAGSYRAVEGRAPVDVFGGLRYASVKWDVDLQVTAPPAVVGAHRFTETKSWTDPYVGARVQWPLAERWSLLGYADIGGFGVGSDLTWQAIAGVNYAFSPTLIGKAGVRFVYVDYDKSGFRYDMLNSGFYVGAGFRF